MSHAEQAAPNPYATASARPAADRLRALKLRTLGVAVAMMACALGGFHLLAPALGRLTAWLWALMRGQTAWPAPHVPQPLLETGSPMAQSVFVGLCLAVMAGHSMGAFGRLKLRWVMLVPLAMAATLVLTAPPATSWLKIVPSQLERDILERRLEAAEQALPFAELPGVALPYVQAQIALRSGNTALLQRAGQQVLRLAERHVHGLETDPAVAEFEPAVLLAIDRALNGTPVTEVGRRTAREGVLGNGGWLAQGARAILGLALLALVWPLLRLWNQMRRRVALIQDGIAGVEAPDLVARAVADGPDAAPVPGRPPRRARNGETVPHGLLHRVQRLMVLGMAVALIYAVGRPALQVTLERLGVGRSTAAHNGPVQACQIVGQWTAVKPDGTSKVTFHADGRFTSEPTGAGQPFSGHWWIPAPGRQIAWTLDGKPIAGNNGVNAILSVSEQAFTLMEGGGQPSHYTRVGARAPGCTS